MLVKPLAGPSTTYMTVPITTVTITTKLRKTKILRRLAQQRLPEGAVLVDVLGQPQDAEQAQQAQHAHVDQRVQAGQRTATARSAAPRSGR